MRVVMYFVMLLGCIVCTQCKRRGRLLQMTHIAWSVCLSVGHTYALSKMAEPTEMPVEWITLMSLTLMGPRNQCIGRGS